MRHTLLALLFAGLGSFSLLAQESEPQLSETTDRVLFDGETLTGFVDRGGRYDGKALWTVEDGVLTGRQGPGKTGGLLYTKDAYRSFIITVETRIDYPFDSGLFVRMVPRPGGKGAQLTLDYREGGEVGAIYADGFLAHNETAKARFKKDAWNRVTLRCVGPSFHLTAWLNGELITDYRLPPHTSGYAERGLIGLQVHGGESVPMTQAARFRRVLIRELPEYDSSEFQADEAGMLSLTDAGSKSGWRPLFNGKDLTGWEPVGAATGDFRVKDGVLLFPKVGGGGYLRTREDFKDFDVRLDFKTRFMANSGLFLRGKRDAGDPAYSGCEVQILDDFNWEKVTGSKLKPWQFTGSLYGSVAPSQRALVGEDRWNTLEVSYHGTRMVTRLNGALLYDVDTLTVPGKPFAERAPSGFIGLQRHAPDQVKDEIYAEFRNLYVRPR